MTYVPEPMPESGATVVVGMSGGVDSTLTALLLRENGCHVIGVTMSLWDGHIKNLQAEDALQGACYSPNQKEHIDDCRRFCRKEGIEYHVIDVSKEYNQEVLEYFKAEYRSGKTPNPCIRCNRFVKFGALLDGLEKIGVKYDYFCTGHYAMIVRPSEGLWGTDKKPCMIACSFDDTKDQTYFLYRLSSDLLEKIRFPLATIKKSEVFELARKAGLEVAEKKESQDFIDPKYFNLIFDDKPAVPGNFVDVNGKVLGRHKGIEHYTIGQRRGLGVAVNVPVYVQKIDAEKNQIVLAEKEYLASAYLIADDFVWPGDIEPCEPFEAFTKIRLRSQSAFATIEKYIPSLDDTYRYQGQPWKISFEGKQNAVAPGQSVVLYKDNVILGGGIIVKGGN